ASPIVALTARARKRGWELLASTGIPPYRGQDEEHPCRAPAEESRASGELPAFRRQQVMSEGRAPKRPRRRGQNLGTVTSVSLLAETRERRGRSKNAQPGRRDRFEATARRL